MAQSSQSKICPIGAMPEAKSRWTEVEKKPILRLDFSVNNNLNQSKTWEWSEVIILTYLSTEMATSVKTLAATVTLATKLFTVQYMAPNGQSEFSMKMKLNMQFNNDIKRSETLRLTRK